MDSGGLFLTGAGGLLGHWLREHAREDQPLIHSSRDGLGRLDLETPQATADQIRDRRPELVIHAAAIAEIGACDREPELAHRVNVEASLELAAAAAEVGARFVFVSTDQVFDGREAPYCETDEPRPLHLYGRGKAEVEERLREQDDVLIVRLPLLVGPSPRGDRSTSERLIALHRSGGEAGLFVDEFRSPAHARDVARAILALDQHRASGLFHLGGPRRFSRHELGQAILESLGLDPGVTIRPARLADHPMADSRPADLELDSSSAALRLGRPLPDPIASIC